MLKFNKLDDGCGAFLKLERQFSGKFPEPAIIYAGNASLIGGRRLNVVVAVDGSLSASHRFLKWRRTV